MGGFTEEVIIPLPASFPALSAARSTLIVSSLATVTENGYAEPYFAALPASLHDTMRGAVVGGWIPVEMAVAHYTACDSIGLSQEAIARIGRGVADKIKGTFLGTAVRLAKETGVSPLTVLPFFPRFWSRVFQGGGICAARVGPKDVRIEAHKSPLLDIPYHRSALRGLVMGVLEPFCSRVYMTEPSGRRPEGSGIFRIQWV